MLAFGMRTLFHRCVFVALLAVAAAGVVVGQTDVEALRAKAEQGNTRAQYNLAVTYATGHGVPQDYAEAVKWYRMAAEQGDATAQYSLGIIYDKGRGVPQDYAEAVKWYRMAAEQGVARAQYNLAVMYAVGQGVPQDYAEAVKWYRMAAEQGVARAQRNLGVMYIEGRGVPQDYVQGHVWMNLAASRLQGEDHERRAKLRESLAKLMTPEQIAQAQRLAREWKPKTWDELKKGLEAEER